MLRSLSLIAVAAVAASAAHADTTAFYAGNVGRFTFTQTLTDQGRETASATGSLSTLRQAAPPILDAQVTDTDYASSNDIGTFIAFYNSGILLSKTTNKVTSTVEFSNLELSSIDGTIYGDIRVNGGLVGGAVPVFTFNNYISGVTYNGFESLVDIISLTTNSAGALNSTFNLGKTVVNGTPVGSFQIVPEPDAVLALGLGAGVVAAVRRKRG